MLIDKSTTVRAPMFQFLDGVTAVAPEAVTSVQIVGCAITYQTGVQEIVFHPKIDHDTLEIAKLEYQRLLNAIENARLMNLKHRDKNELRE